jgi:hypothetical protein
MPYNKGAYVTLTEEQVKFHENALKKPLENKLDNKFPTFPAPSFTLKSEQNGKCKTTGSGATTQIDTTQNSGGYTSGVSASAHPDADDNDKKLWGEVTGLPKANYKKGTTAQDKADNAKDLLPAPWSVWDNEERKVFAKCVEISKTELKNKVDLKRAEWSTAKSAQEKPGFPWTSMPYKHTDRVVRCLGTCAKDNKASIWAHKLILYADVTRNPRGEASKALARLKADPATAHLADMDSGKFVAEVSSYKLTNDIERDLLYLECIPKSARAYLALKYIENNPIFNKRDGFGTELQEACKSFLAPSKEQKIAQRAKFVTNAATNEAGYFKESSGPGEEKQEEYKLDAEKCDLIHNVFTPTAPCRAEWIRDALLDDYNIVFEARVKTHREPLIEQWNAVHNIYGKAGPVSEDGLIQQGHYMRVGTKKANKENKFNSSLEIFWLSNREPPLGSKSAWIPDAFGGVREVWFSTASDASEEEDRAFKDGRLPYMLYSEQVKARPWEMWAPDAALNLEDHQEIPYPSAVPVAPRLTVLENGEHVPSKSFQETQYYPSVGNNAAAGTTVGTAVPSTMYNPTIPGSYAAPVAAPAPAAAAPVAAESGDYSDYSDYSDYGYGGYSDYSDYGYSDYSY